MKTRPVLPAALLALLVVGAGQSASADDAAAMDLARASGCMACHALDTKVIGPSWHDVAARYKDDAAARDTLIAKVKSGGGGNWTEVTGGIPMPPNSPRVSDDNIATLVDFLLSLD